MDTTAIRPFYPPHPTPAPKCVTNPKATVLSCPLLLSGWAGPQAARPSPLQTLEPRVSVLGACLSMTVLPKDAHGRTPPQDAEPEYEKTLAMDLGSTSAGPVALNTLAASSPDVQRAADEPPTQADESVLTIDDGADDDDDDIDAPTQAMDPRPVAFFDPDRAQPLTETNAPKSKVPARAAAAARAALPTPAASLTPAASPSPSQTKPATPTASPMSSSPPIHTPKTLPNSPPQPPTQTQSTITPSGNASRALSPCPSSCLWSLSSP